MSRPVAPLIAMGMWWIAAAITDMGPVSGDVLEGPRGVQQTLKSGDALTNPHFRSLGLEDVFARWFALKQRLKEEHHLDLGFDYHAAGVISTSDLGAGRALGHDLRFYGAWTAADPGGPNSGALTFKVENRNSYTPVAPQHLGFDSGADAITVELFSNAGWILTNFYWTQRLLDERLTVHFGQVDVTDCTDPYPWPIRSGAS